VKQRDLLELILLAAIWGGSFLFMRVGVPEFGFAALAGLRVIGATLVLMPLVAMRGELPALRTHWRPIFFVGLTNSALPFVLFAFAALSISAGLSSIFNAGAPLFGALIAWLWLNDTLSKPRIVGVIVGFAGVFGLAWSKATLKTDTSSAALAIGACLLATLSYGFSANFAKRCLTGVPPIAVAAGSQLSAAVALLAPTILLWPAHAPSVSGWTHVLLLAVVCTGLAYVMYFRLIANVGPSNAITVTFLVPAFAVVWGAVFLHETLTLQMIIGCAVILSGTALATGLLPRPRRPAGAVAP
jgi:drug/metabolite transporter (DMT)-like permease